MVQIKYKGIPNIKNVYRGIDGSNELELDASDPAKSIAEVSEAKAKQVISDIPEEFEVMKGGYKNKMVSTAPSKKFQWSDDLKHDVVKAYQKAKPTPESSKSIVEQLSSEYGANMAAIRIVLIKAGVYVKK